MATQADLKAQLNDLAGEVTFKDRKIHDLEMEIEDLRAKGRQARDIAEEAKKEKNEAQMQFADLKRRLHNAEILISKYQGYFLRVQEDDIVREELIETGDPDGERTLRPKRKHIDFNRDLEYPYMEMRPQSEMQYMPSEERRRHTKHWINY